MTINIFAPYIMFADLVVLITALFILLIFERGYISTLLVLGYYACRLVIVLAEYDMRFPETEEKDKDG